MARPVSEHPTELELSILKILWKESPATVQTVRESLASEGRDLTHSSVITVMNIMVRKQYLQRTKEGRAFAYQPIIEEQSVSRGMLGDLVDRVFDGSASAVILELLETGDVDLDELKEVRRLINRKAKEQS